MLSEKLQYVIVPKVKRRKCVKDYKGRYEVTERQVCYGFSQGGKDACKVNYNLFLIIDKNRRKFLKNSF